MDSEKGPEGKNEQTLEEIKAVLSRCSTGNPDIRLKIKGQEGEMILRALGTEFGQAILMAKEMGTGNQYDFKIGEIENIEIVEESK